MNNFIGLKKFCSIVFI